jgi:hypothetical protein
VKAWACSDFWQNGLACDRLEGMAGAAPPGRQLPVRREDFSLMFNTQGHFLQAATQWNSAGLFFYILTKLNFTLFSY